MHEVSRRSFLAASALAGAAFAAPANAAVPFAGVQGPGVYRFKLGDFQISAIFDGVWYLPIDDKLVRNASGPDVNQALAAAFLLRRGTFTILGACAVAGLVLKLV